jgi:predicted unusual protein kinase regulating ubiquinone biosynthesis (AarF/ABC1/UbiB family)
VTDASRIDDGGIVPNDSSFATFDPTPLATGSIGQAHLAA